jgi:hypothetical protein
MSRAIACHRNVPFIWGSSDCALAFDVMQVMTGRDAIADLRGYVDEFTLLRRLVAAGFETGVQLVEARFREIAPVNAMRGDLGYPADVPHRLMSPAVIDGAYAYSKGPQGFITIPRSQITRAFAV